MLLAGLGLLHREPREVVKNTDAPALPAASLRGHWVEPQETVSWPGVPWGSPCSRDHPLKPPGLPLATAGVTHVKSAVPTASLSH